MAREPAYPDGKSFCKEWEQSPCSFERKIKEEKIEMTAALIGCALASLALAAWVFALDRRLQRLERRGQAQEEFLQKAEEERRQWDNLLSYGGKPKEEQDEY